MSLDVDGLDLGNVEGTLPLSDYVRPTAPNFLILVLALKLPLLSLSPRDLLQNESPLFVTFLVVAVGALTVGVARNTGLEALAVLLEASAALALAAFGMSHLVGLLERVFTSLPFLLALPHVPVYLAKILGLKGSLRSRADILHANDALTELRGILTDLTCFLNDFGSEGVRILLYHRLNGLSSQQLVVLVVLAVTTGTVWAAVLSPGEALTVQFQALAILAATALPFLGHAGIIALHASSLQESALAILDLVGGWSVLNILVGL